MQRTRGVFETIARENEQMRSLNGCESKGVQFPTGIREYTIMSPRPDLQKDHQIGGLFFNLIQVITILKIDKIIFGKGCLFYLMFL